MKERERGDGGTERNREGGRGGMTEKLRAYWEPNYGTTDYFTTS